MGGAALAFAVDDSSARKIVGGKSDPDLIARNDPDVMLAHLARQVCEDNVAGLYLDTEHGVWERFLDYSLYFDCVFFCHMSSR